MMSKIIFVILFCPCCLCAGEDEKGMIVYGDKFSFIIIEPDKWRGYTKDTYRYNANAYFCPEGYSFTDSPALIYIRVLNKSGYDIAEHLAADMAEYKEKGKKVEFEEYKPENLTYRYVSKKYLINNQYCDYLIYLDPSEDSSIYLLFVLSVEKAICDDYIKLFNDVLDTFTWIGQDVRYTPKK